MLGIQGSSGSTVEFSILESIKSFFFVDVIFSVHFEFLISLFFVFFYESDHLFVESFKIGFDIVGHVLRFSGKENEES